MVLVIDSPCISRPWIINVSIIPVETRFNLNYFQMETGMFPNGNMPVNLAQTIKFRLQITIL